MIRILVLTHDESILEISAQGHAFSGEPGHDLVCAAVSSIMVGALNALDLLTEGVSLTLSPDPIVKMKVESINSKNQLLLNSVLIQLKTIEETQKKYIRISEKEVVS